MKKRKNNKKRTKENKKKRIVPQINNFFKKRFCYSCDKTFDRNLNECSFCAEECCKNCLVKMEKVDTTKFRKLHLLGNRFQTDYHPTIFNQYKIICSSICSNCFKATKEI